MNNCLALSTLEDGLNDRRVCQGEENHAAATPDELWILAASQPPLHSVHTATYRRTYTNQYNTHTICVIPRRCLFHSHAQKHKPLFLLRPPYPHTKALVSCTRPMAVVERMFPTNQLRGCFPAWTLYPSGIAQSFSLTLPKHSISFWGRSLLSSPFFFFVPAPQWYSS